MKITIVGRQMNVPEETKALLAKKLSKLDKYFDDEGEATVAFSRKHGKRYIEVTINAANTLFRCELEGESFRESIDRAVETIEGQIRKNKTRLERRLREDAFKPSYNDEDAYSELLDDYDEDPEFIIRRKSFYFKPMTPEEAILQMNLIGHQFFVFRDAETEDTCVVYLRKDGSYGLITPEN